MLLALTNRRENRPQSQSEHLADASRFEPEPTLYLCHCDHFSGNDATEYIYKLLERHRIEVIEFLRPTPHPERNSFESVFFRHPTGPFVYLHPHGPCVVFWGFIPRHQPIPAATSARWLLDLCLDGVAYAMTLQPQK